MGPPSSQLWAWLSLSTFATWPLRVVPAGGSRRSFLGSVPHGVCVRGEGTVQEDAGSCWSWCRGREGVPGPRGAGRGGREEKGTQSSGEPEGCSWALRSEQGHLGPRANQNPCLLVSSALADFPAGPAAASVPRPPGGHGQHAGAGAPPPAADRGPVPVPGPERQLPSHQLLSAPGPR